MRVIGFGHKKKVGKDTAVRFALAHLRQEYPHIKSCRRGFSDAIKDIAFRAYAWGGLQDDLFYANHPNEEDIELPAIGKSPRQIWDELGTKLREICPKTWAELIFYDLDADIVLFDGIRFPTEIDYVRQFNGKVYRIIKDNAPKSEHEVDHALDGYQGWDGTIDNNGTMRDFGKQIKEIVDQCVKEWNL